MRLPFEPIYRQRYYELLDEVFESNFWSDGGMTKRFERAFGGLVGLPARAVSSGGTALLAILEYLDVRGKDVVVPANTFWATPQAVRKAGGRVTYADCNREDLCMSLEDLKGKMSRTTAAVCLVHIGGHLAFESSEIAAFCREREVPLVEDCAHAHGATWIGMAGGHFGFAGAYSFYATKTMPLGEGGIVVSRDEAFLEWIERHRNYGKCVVGGRVTYPLKEGFNYRMSELTAALGLVQMERLPRILEWKRALAARYDQMFDRRVRLPEGMQSGFYKYVAFDYPHLRQQTGQVFGPLDLGPTIEGVAAEVPNSRWIAEHHQCPPIWYGWEHGGADVKQLQEVLL